MRKKSRVEEEVISIVFLKGVIMENPREQEALSEMFTKLNNKRVDLARHVELINHLQGKINILEDQFGPIKRKVEEEIVGLLQEIGWKAKMTGIRINEEHQVPRLFIPFSVVKNLLDRFAFDKITIDQGLNPFIEEEFVREVLIKLRYEVQRRNGDLMLERKRGEPLAPLYSCTIPPHRDFSNEELLMLEDEVLAELPRFKKEFRSRFT